MRASSRLPALLACLLLASFMLSAQTLTPVAPPKPAIDTVKADTLAAKKPVARADTAKIVMHSFNHRQQLITGGAIMATMVGIMVVMNNYNPRMPQ